MVKVLNRHFSEKGIQIANKYMKRCSIIRKSGTQWNITPHYHNGFIKMTRDHIVGETVEKREPKYTVGGNVNWYSHYWKRDRDSLKTENRTTIWSSNSTPGCTSREKRNALTQKETCALTLTEHYLQQPGRESNPSVHQQEIGLERHCIYTRKGGARGCSN